LTKLDFLEIVVKFVKFLVRSLDIALIHPLWRTRVITRWI